MQKGKLSKKVLAVTLAAAMTAGSGLTAFAADYNFTPPTEPMEVNDDIITVSVHRAGSVLPEILGLNTVCGFSMINGSMPTTLEEAQTKLMLGVFGTDANEEPDPYYYNYFYNFYAEANGLDVSENAVIIPENNVAASPAKADTTIIDEYGTSISLAGRPDILIGVSSSNSADDVNGYDELIAQIRTGAIGSDYYQEGDEDYDPYLVSYTTTTTYDMITALNETAELMNEITAETGKTGRYETDPVEIAEQFGDYVCGVSTYVLSELESQGKAKKSVAVVQNINSDGTFTIADAASQDATSTVRGVEYVALVSDNIASEYGTTGITAEQLLSADVVIISGSNGGGSDDTALPNTKAGLIEALEVSGYTEEDIEDMMIITDNPDTIYGITMNSIENGMGFGYFIGYMYSDTIDIDPVEMCTYFYEQFYHVTDSESLQSITSSTFSDVTLPEGMDTDISEYNTADIDAKLAQGKAYYYANFEKFAETALVKVWPENAEDGIASGTSAQYDTSYDATWLAGLVEDLNTEVASALASDEMNNYTASTVAAYETAMTNANTVLANEDATAYEIKSALEAIQSAKSGLTATIDTVALRASGTNQFTVSYSNEDPSADMTFTYGKATDQILIGDWDGDGVDTLCVRRGNTYYFLNTACEDLSSSSNKADFTLNYGKGADEVLVGDWDGDGIDTLCVRRGNTYYFSNDLESTKAQYTVTYGKTSDAVLIGDWDGDGTDTLCVRRDGNRYYFLSTAAADMSSGSNKATTVLNYGKSSDETIVGDWDGDQVDTLCARRGDTYYFGNDLESTKAAFTSVFGTSSDTVFAGTWTR